MNNQNYRAIASNDMLGVSESGKRRGSVDAAPSYSKTTNQELDLFNVMMDDKN